MAELGGIFRELGISHYLHDFLEQGFDTWEEVLDIRESDFDALGVKLGHRRKLQRKIASFRGISPDKPLAPTRNTPSHDRQPRESRSGHYKVDNKDGECAVRTTKRRYRRHPEPDKNAPERPPSAYVIFSITIREESKGANLSFAELAKLVGRKWQNLSPDEKRPYERQALSTKERYNDELAEYKGTDNYTAYSQYLAEFKAGQSMKKLKLEAHSGTASTGTGSSDASQHHEHGSASRIRVESSGSTASQWRTVHALRSPRLLGGLKGLRAPSTASPTVLPGCREAISCEPEQALPSRDAQRDHDVTSVEHLSVIATSGNRPSYSGSPLDKLNFTGSLQHAYRTSHVHPPLSLTTGSLTYGPSKPSGSAASSVYSVRQTLMEPLLLRALPIPSVNHQKSNDPFENQLPPLRLPFLSPRSTVLSSQEFPNNMTREDFPSPMDPIQSYDSTALQRIAQVENSTPRHADLVTPTLGDKNIFEPVSALLKAAEVLDQNCRSRPGS